MTDTTPELGTGVPRREGRDKVAGAARYAAEYAPPGRAHAWPVPATVAAGSVRSVDDTAALALPGVLAVLTAENTPPLAPADDPVLDVLQNADVPHRGWIVALVVAETLEAARAGAQAVRVSYDTRPHDVTLTRDHPDRYVPENANGGHPAVRERGDAPGAFADAPVRVDAAYDVPPLHNHPMEPHAATAFWADGHLTAHDSSQGGNAVRAALAQVFDLPEERVTVTSAHVGGGFGSKGTPRPHVVLAALAARHTGRPVTLALPRRDLPASVGHRAPTLHRVRLGADSDGRLLSVEHTALTHTSRVKEFVEQAAVPARVMYGSPHSSTVHEVVPLDVATPSWMRAPGEASGMYALEAAMDELAERAGLDPVELRVRNDPADEPDSGRPFSSRHLVECLREGARRFGWQDRDPRPGVRREGPRLTGTGVAAATYPVLVSPCRASATALPDGGYRVRVNATDIGTGARTVLGQIAADALGVPGDRLRVEIGDSDLPRAPLAGGSSGTASWGWAVHEACTTLARRLAGNPEPPSGGLTAEADTTEAVEAGSPYARHAFGAHFAEVRVDTDTGEVRVLRAYSHFAAGRILNARTARSQFLGGMVMGIGMALTERSTLDPAFGGFVERDLAAYHVPVSADVPAPPAIDAGWFDERDPHLNPVGGKGIGEIGIVGMAAAVGNAAHHATGVRFRSLPLTPDKVRAALAGGT
ncbi:MULTISPECIES: xanthine dehydrogenase family protein molybdopterin-binding subunit [Streptomyces]|uniref:Oxidoreductase n=3 Tax=Streptomyces TaxID=1883 RepID=A0A8H9HCA9_9ACTN|nr:MULTISPECIES: xanthine dehydrogenase family protein molybdopterin-binding subunit [Streptomyces]PJM83807.1 xanthine dehydrogenase [Streptomyces sp. TSRI0384-2]RPK87430.1 Xanthine dehydrogenase molybdenum-binding subunit [Streptomyces sp. ADI98-12]GFH73724.1 oxidoreductase [Streptomyces diastaticus subsp. diastaticus]GFH79105.1 oxidoreductase [Streptomyces gougerotii]GGU07668.1 oxidoreductase [Streptomyces diastaticus subsp. diastaticus]